MSARRNQEIPESTLVDDKPPRRGYRSRYADKDYQTDKNMTAEHSKHREQRTSLDDEQMITQGQHRTPAYLRTYDQATPKVDVDITSLSSLGRTNKNKWAATTSQRYTSNTTSDKEDKITTKHHSGTIHSGDNEREDETIDKQHPTTTQVSEQTTPTLPKTLRERPEPHPQQLRPSAALYQLAQTLYKRNPALWTIEDVHTPQSSDGTSILVSALVDYASTSVKPELSTAQCLHLAQVAVATSPVLLLEYIQDQTKCLDFIQQVEILSTPPSLEKNLHPAATPGLIYDSSLRRSLLDKDITRTEMIEIIQIYAGCYYPKQAVTIRDFLKSVTVQVLLDYIYKPGYFAIDLQNRSRQMNFSPPKWYRLSIHPEEKISATPRRQLTWQSIPISLPDVELNLGVDILHLIQQPFSAQRTALLAAIPLIFDSRPSREGCIETLALVDNATPEELYTFLTKHTPNPPAQKAPTHDTNQNSDTEDALHSLYCVRFEHTDRKKQGFWNESPGAVLLRWMKAVLPVMKENNFTLTLSQAPHTRVPNDRDLTSAFTVTSTQLEDFTHNCKSNKKLTSFEVWIKSTCPDLNELLMVSKSGDKATDYITGMKTARIWLEVISQTIDGIVPVLMLGGSIETDPDDMIGAELNDRLLQTKIDLAHCPNFDITYCAVHTSSTKGSVMAKCVMANKDSAPKLHQLFDNIITPGMQERHLVTRDYFFAPISYPPSDRSDRELTSAMNRQREYTDSIIQTTITGLIDVNPFTDVPAYTKDLCTHEIEKNNKSLVELILLGKILDTTDTAISSPIRKISTNRKRNQLHLTALKTETGNLIAATKAIAKTMEVWYPGRKMRPRCDLETTRIYMETNISEQAATRVTMLPQAINDRWKSEELIKTQLQMENAGNQTDLVATAKQGIEQTFTQGREQDSGTTNVPDTPDQGQPTNTIAEHQQNTDLRNEITELKEEITAIKNIIKDHEQHPRVISEDTLASTISTMVETNIQASFTSTAKLVALCESQLIEQTMMMTSFITHFSQKLIDIHTRVSDAKKNDDEVLVMIQSHQQVILNATAEITAMRTVQEKMIRTLEQKSTPVQSKEHSIITTPGVDTDTTPPKEITEPAKPIVELKEGKDHKIRARAMGILNLAETLPYKSKQRTWEEEADEEDRQQQAKTETEQDSAKTTQKNCCAKCNGSDLGLIYCDRCPEDACEVYHPTCLTFIKNSMERICTQCEINPPRRLADQLSTTKQALGAPPLKTPEEEDDAHTKETAPSPPQSEEDPTNIGASTSNSDQSDSSFDSTSSEDSFENKYPQRMKSTPKSKMDQNPPYLNRENNISTTQQSLDPMIASPVKTRAARRAAESTSQESATDTDTDNNTN